MVRPIEELADHAIQELAEDYASHGRGMQWNDCEHVSAYYGFLAGWNAFRGHLSLSGDSARFTKVDELEKFMVMIDMATTAARRGEG